MNVIFETPRFRVQISGKAAWLESVESGEWVLRGQIAIPVAADALSGDANPSLLRDAVLDFEQVRPGDTRLRAALTGHREAVQTPPRAIAPPPPQPRPQQAAPPARTRSSIWSPRPLRPPLGVKPA
jgi:hypothetical protein